MTGQFPGARPGVIVFALCLLAADAARGQTDATAAEQRLDEVSRELESLNTWLEDADKRLSRLQAEISRADDEVAGINQRIRDLNTEIDDVRQSLAQLEDQRREVDERRIDQANRIARHVRAAHRLVGSGFFKVLLNRESPDTVDRIVRYHRYFVRARLDALDAYARTLNRIEEIGQATREREQALAAREGELKSRTARLSETRRERETLAMSLRREMRDKVVSRDQLLRDRKRLQSLLVRLDERLRDEHTVAFAASKGRMHWPVVGRVLHRFGEARADGRLKWEGIYLAAAEGTRINAIHSGRVVFADWLRGFGLLTIIDHGNRYMSLYGNADTLLKQAGDWVESGEPIASAGRSGGRDVSGVYFEVRAAGRPTNPTAWLRGEQPR